MDFSKKIAIIFQEDFDSERRYKFFEDYKEIKETIKKDCGFYLKKFGVPIYRIIANHEMDGDFLKKNIRTDRRPKDTAKIINVLINKLLEEADYIKRSESLFCYADLNKLDEFYLLSGSKIDNSYDKYAIFPIGPCRTQYFRGIFDLTMQYDLNTYSLIEPPNDQDMNSDELQDYLWSELEKSGDYDEFEIDEKKKRLRKLLDLLMNNIVKDNLSDIRNEEIMFKGSSYYAVKIPSKIHDAHDKKYMKMIADLYRIK